MVVYALEFTGDLVFFTIYLAIYASAVVISVLNSLKIAVGILNLLGLCCFMAAKQDIQAELVDTNVSSVGLSLQGCSAI